MEFKKYMSIQKEQVFFSEVVYDKIVNLQSEVTHNSFKFQYSHLYMK